MLKIGITGQSGFVGSHLYNTIGLFPDTYERVAFAKAYFENPKKLEQFVSSCDVIVHLAAVNRHEDQQVLHNINVSLAEKLVRACEQTNSAPHIIFSSSSQEERDNLYGNSKKKGRTLLKNWASENDAIFTGMIVPNVYGPFGKPFYNSVVATFCHQIANGQTPEVKVDGTLNLIYVNELVSEIINAITTSLNDSNYNVAHTQTKKVSEIKSQLENFKHTYQEQGSVPELKSTFDLNLFNTYCCYIDIKNHFPVMLTKHTDDRGSFVEIIRVAVGGQSSFSSTVPGITRGNHFHTRKIERFAVIQGKALIQLRKIDTTEVFEFVLDGDKPAYVDMPIWYTHNIKNIGDEILLTNFWINEPYDPSDPDTYFVTV